MTPNDQDTNAMHLPGSPVDKVLDHTRLQLSALIDGELPPDEARFLLRRLDHDTELRDCWERWQLCGDVLRGRVDGWARDGLAARVADAVATEPLSKHAPVGNDRRWWRWGSGAALAASVAMVALFLTRQSPDVRPSNGVPAQVAVTRQPVQAPTQPVATTPAPAPTAPGAAEVASALAVADVPRRMAARRSRGQSQRAALHSPTRAPVETPVAVAAAAPFGTPAAAVDPFSGQHVRLPNRPWPRALLPGAPSGAFNVDYGSRSEMPVRPLSPFTPRPAPRLVPAPADEADADVPTP